MTVYRVQGPDGRGPYKPGFSHVWSDMDRCEGRPTIFAEFGATWLKELRPTETHGCAFRTIEDALRWFSVSELERLAKFGYKLCEVSGVRVLRESPRQLIVARSSPFHYDCKPILFVGGAT